MTKQQIQTDLIGRACRIRPDRAKYAVRGSLPHDLRNVELEIRAVWLDDGALYTAVQRLDDGTVSDCVPLAWLSFAESKIHHCSDCGADMEGPPSAHAPGCPEHRG